MTNRERYAGILRAAATGRLDGSARTHDARRAEMLRKAHDCGIDGDGRARLAVWHSLRGESGLHPETGRALAFGKRV